MEIFTYLYTICEHDILDINVEFFFLKQYDYILRNSIFSGNLHEVHVPTYLPTCMQTDSVNYWMQFYTEDYPNK